MRAQSEHNAMQRAEERCWLEAARGGDARAFGKVVRCYQQRAYRAALAILGNPDDAWDLAQDGFVRAFDRLEQYNVELPFYPWFHRLLRNLCLNHLRWRRRRREDSMEAMEESGSFLRADPATSPERVAATHILGEQISMALRRLRPAAREILVMREIEDLSYAEIATLLEIPKGTVMSRLHHARRALRAELAPYHAEMVS
jgi:RNA polymerase sigma-70 factor (ECF subfamily)